MIEWFQILYIHIKNSYKYPVVHQYIQLGSVSYFISSSIWYVSSHELKHLPIWAAQIAIAHVSNKYMHELFQENETLKKLSNFDLTFCVLLVHITQKIKSKFESFLRVPFSWKLLKIVSVIVYSFIKKTSICYKKVWPALLFPRLWHSRLFMK